MLEIYWDFFWMTLGIGVVIVADVIWFVVLLVKNLDRE